MRCPLCHSNSDQFTESQGRSFRLCSVCKLVFVDPGQFLSPSDEISRYREHENSLENEGYVKMFRDKITIIQQYCKGIKAILDYGCGYEPVLCSVLEMEGYAAQAYDYYFFPEWNEKASFDLIVSTETFEHFRNPREDLKRIEPCIKENGYLAIMTKWYPMENEVPDEAEFKSWYYQRDPSHIVFYGPDTFLWIANHLQMKIVYNNEFDFIIMQKGVQQSGSLS